MTSYYLLFVAAMQCNVIKALPAQSTTAALFPAHLLVWTLHTLRLRSGVPASARRVPAISAPTLPMQRQRRYKRGPFCARSGPQHSSATWVPAVRGGCEDQHQQVSERQ